jgi:uncharacterized surface protein with fasciclin (FAS1) repeats
MADFTHVARAAGELNRFVALLESGAGRAFLAEAGEITLFAPDDAALAEIPADPAQIRALLADHAAPGALVAADLMEIPALRMVGGQAHPISTERGLQIGDSYLTSADQIAEQGVLHILDRPLPSSASDAR